MYKMPPKAGKCLVIFYLLSMKTFQFPLAFVTGVHEHLNSKCLLIYFVEHITGSQYCNITETQGRGGGSIQLPSYHGNGINLLVRPWVNEFCHI